MSPTKKSNENIQCASCVARESSIFCNLNHDDQEKLNALKECFVVKKGETIFHEGTRPHGLYCMNEGKVKITKIGDEGKEQIIHFAKAGDVLGYRAILSSDSYNCSATAIEETKVCFIPKNQFLDMVQQNVQLSLKVISLLSTELKEAEKAITDLAQKSVRERVAEGLLILKQAYGFEDDKQTIAVKLTREEIANLVGTATESCIRTLSDLSSDNIIDLKGKAIKILDINKLIRAANIID